MKNRFRLSGLLTLSLSLATSPRVVFAQDVAEEEVSEDEVAAEDATDEEVMADEDVADEDVVSDEEAADEDVVSDDEVVAEDGDEEVVADEEASETAAESTEEETTGEEEAVEEGLWEPGEEPYRAAPAGKGVVWGRLVDEATGEPAIEAQVKAEGTNIETYTDIDGYYRLELPPGTYTLKLFYELYEEASLENVGVGKGAVQRVDAKMKPQAGAIEEEIIEDQAETQTVEGLALARQRSVAQGDAVGREEITKTTDTNAAQAAQRVVGATIVDGRFVYVRGLGQRYSNSLLGGYPLPSPEPDVAAVPLDVFPTGVIDSITIAKTFSPDSPGDFAGGSVQIETRSVPSKPLFQVSLRADYNTQSTFRDRLTQPHSSTDWLGFDSGMRKMPDSVPSDRAVADQSDPENTPIGRDMNTRMSSMKQKSPFDHRFNIVGGNTFDLGKVKLGALGSVNYSHTYQRYENATVASFRGATDDPRGYEDLVTYEADQGISSVRWGAFGKLSLLAGNDHKITVSGFHSQLADDITSEFEGYNREVQNTYHTTQMDWIERGLTFGMLSGRHTFPGLKRAELGWDVALSKAYRYEPDRRDTVYLFSERIPDPDDETGRGRTQGWVYENKTESGRHFWAEQTEKSNGGKIDYRQPILEGKTDLAAKFGGLVNVKRREFNVRRFQFNPEVEGASTNDPVYSCIGETYSGACADKLFQDENIGRYLWLADGSQEGDAYKASLDVYAGYLMGDVDFRDRLRVVAGVRMEHTRQKVDPYTPFGDPIPEQNTKLVATDWLPAASLVFSATKKIKTRLSYGKTLARPQTRELAPFAFADYFGGAVVAGNPDLILTEIHNFDTRFEYWPSLAEVMAVSFFLKTMKDPIEAIQVPTGGAPQVTFQNSPGAQVIGAEFEVRKDLSMFHARLAPFSVVTNLTLAHSKVELQEDAGNFILTNPSRPLVNQAPWVVNAALNYENEMGTNGRIIYNVSGKTLDRAGVEGLPDSYQQPMHSLDFAISQKFLDHWSVRFQVQNILNSWRVVTMGKKPQDIDGDGTDDNIVQKFRNGTVFGLGFGYEL